MVLRPVDRCFRLLGPLLSPPPIFDAIAGYRRDSDESAISSRIAL